MPTFNFMQLADPQLGMFAAMSGRGEEEQERTRERFAPMLPAGPSFPRVAPGVVDSAPEQARLRFAIEQASTLQAAFVVICGDLTHHLDRPEEVEDFLAAARSPSDNMPVHLIPGNHDLATAPPWLPTPETLALYRERYGDDYYAFEHGGSLFLALNSETMGHPEHVQDEVERQFEFIGDELSSRRGREAQHRISFMHTPPFWGDPAEEQMMALGLESRQRLLTLFEEFDLRTVFTGHLHLNRYASDGAVDVVVSGAAGYPIAGQSGYRMVQVSDDGVSHAFSAFGDGLALP